MNEREYLRLRTEIQRRYDDDMRSLERVWEIARKEPRQRQGQAAVASVQQAFAEVDPTSLVHRTRAALPPPGIEFTVRKIETAIHQGHPEVNGSLSIASLSRTLKRFADKGEIRIKRIGRGKRATVYEVPVNSS